MRQLFYVGMVFLMAIAISSCTEENEKVKPSFYQTLTGKTKKTWRMTSLQWTGDGKNTLNFSVASCIRDNLYIFYANEERLYEVDNGSSKCNSNEAQALISDVWSLNSATSTLTIIFPLLSDNALPFTLRSLKSNELVFDIYLDNEEKYTYKITMTSVSEE